MHEHEIVIFDLDGTLIDSRADLAQAVNLTRRDYSLPPLPVALVSSYVGEGLKLLIQRSLPERPDVLDEAVAKARVHYGSHLLDQTILYPGVAEGLARIADLGYRQAVLTNKPHEFTESILTGFGIRRHFAAVLGGRPGAKLKPDPAPVREILAATDCTAAGSWIAGDHFTDLEVGRRTGLKRCYCRFGFGNPGTETWDLVADRFDEFAAYLATVPATN